MAHPYNAIHFDMDGVIVDTEPTHVRAEILTCQEAGFIVDESQWGGFKGRTAVDIFTHIRENFDYDGPGSPPEPGELVELKTDVFISILSTEGVIEIEGVLDFIEWSRGNFKKRSLVTSINRRTQRFICQALGLDEEFDHVVTGNDVSNGKPHPEPYLLTRSGLGLKASDKSLVVEDSYSGVQSALSAETDVLAIATSHTLQELQGFQPAPTYIVDSFAHAPAAISYE